MKKVKDENNAYGYKQIDFIQFNYDGDGSSICFNDGELSSYCENDTNMILFGDPVSGDKCYKLVK